MLFDKKAVQENIRNRDGKRVFYLGKGHQLTSDARDWLTSERIPILSAEQAKPNGYRLLGGGILEKKPEHMTHLNAEFLVDKTHPRIAFRGGIDSLEAALLLADEKQLRERSHRPQDFYGKPHFMPQPTDSKALLLVNFARCKAREAELLAVKAFRDAEGLPTRVDLLQALNRLSSFLYLIMLQLKE